MYGTVAVAGGERVRPVGLLGLSALSARTGRLLWRVPVGPYLYSSPAVYKGRVYFGAYKGLVYSAWPTPAGSLDPPPPAAVLRRG